MREDSEFEKELEALINKYSKESESDTPDFILARYLQGSLVVFADAVVKRDRWMNQDERVVDE